MTTIHISNKTKQLLQEWKKKENAASYDEAIQKLAVTRTMVDKCLFGIAKGMKWNKSTDRMQAHEL